TYSRVFPNGLPYGWPCHPSTTCGPDRPRPSRNRPPLMRSSVAAVMAVIAGVRAGICMIAEPTCTRSVCAASQVSGVMQSVPSAAPARATRAWCGLPGRQLFRRELVHRHRVARAAPRRRRALADVAEPRLLRDASRREVPHIGLEKQPYPELRTRPVSHEAE